MYFPGGSWKAEISNGQISDLSRKCCSTTDTVSRWSLGAPHTCASALGTAGGTGPTIPCASWDRNAQRHYQHSPAVATDRVPHRCWCDNDLSPRPGHGRPLQEHRCFTRCSRGLSPSAGHRVAPVPPSARAPLALPVLPRLSAPGWRITRERRGTGTLLFLLPAAGAARYRQGELGSGTGGGRSAPGPAGGARPPGLAPTRVPQHRRGAERRESPGRARSVLLHRYQRAKANSWGRRGEGAILVHLIVKAFIVVFLTFLSSLLKFN